LGDAVEVRRSERAVFSGIEHQPTRVTGSRLIELRYQVPPNQSLFLLGESEGGGTERAVFQVLSITQPVSLGFG